MFEPYPLYIQIKPNEIKLRRWNYTTHLVLFVTFLTEDKKPFLGEVVNDGCYGCNCGRCIDSTQEISAMQYSTEGQSVFDTWNDMWLYFASVQVAQVVVMPNHIHGILILEKQAFAADSNIMKRIYDFFAEHFQGILVRKPIEVPICNNDMYLQVMHMIQRSSKNWRLDALYAFA